MKTLIATVLGEVREVEKIYVSGHYDCPYCGYPCWNSCENPACVSNVSDPKKLEEIYNQEKEREKELKRFQIMYSSYGRK